MDIVWVNIFVVVLPVLKVTPNWWNVKSILKSQHKPQKRPYRIEWQDLVHYNTCTLKNVAPPLQLYYIKYNQQFQEIIHTFSELISVVIVITIVVGLIIRRIPVMIQIAETRCSSRLKRSLQNSAFRYLKELTVLNVGLNLCYNRVQSWIFSLSKRI